MILEITIPGSPSQYMWCSLKSISHMNFFPVSKVISHIGPGPISVPVLVFLAKLFPGYFPIIRYSLQGYPVCTATSCRICVYFFLVGSGLWMSADFSVHETIKCPSYWISPVSFHEVKRGYKLSNCRPHRLELFVRFQKLKIYSNGSNHATRSGLTWYYHKSSLFQLIC